jgi:uncharacterized protein (TIGR04255 family)
MRFTRRDNSRLLQLGRDLLIVNQLRPYPHYEQWREKTLAALKVYRQLAEPAGIRHLGVRYINRINIPKGTDGDVRMEHYFRVYPEIPSELGRAHGPFMLQVLMRPVCTDHQLTLMLGMIPSEQPDAMTFMMDLYDVVQFGGPDAFGQVDRLMDEGHANIVHTFENTVTSALRELFGEIASE